ncbi:Putative Prolyl 4-hydroxylase, alpha subunit [[Torrubiella] hemipterigena]|uniref:Putative Prolyl 4-hydroxylase, alpha subunit n=1 Tax=[Torrubiella] hemipterigena TaxID=1531966 RepID=A0A0A1T738_9HYPO|nr:Putative Prolyl 4-hydroxylase, alpha subunit [[Torrubiella] hemipterigena]
MPKPKAAKAPPPPKAPTQQSKPPSWPQFKPPLPVVDLELVPNPSTSKIITISSFFPRSLCRDYVSFLSSLPLVTTPGKPKRGEAVRVNDRFQVDDAVFAKILWEKTGLKEVLTSEEYTETWGGVPIGLNPNIRIYRYSKGQYFDCHYDDYNDVNLNIDGSLVAARTTWTLLLYLTSSAEGCIGGETVFYPHDRQSAKEEIAVALETGTLLLHKHGDDCLLHEGREVKQGEKWVLRTDLCIRR